MTVTTSQLDGKTTIGENAGVSSTHRHGNVDAERLAAQEYVDNVPWDVWEAEFFDERDEHGNFLYPSIWHFAKGKTSVVCEQRWICWSIGRCPEPPMHLSEAQWVDWQPPVQWRGDWVLARMQRPALLPQGLVAMRKAVDAGDDPRQTSRACAEHQIDLLVRLEGILHQLDIFFGGQVFDPNLTLEANDRRAFIYMEYLKEIYKLTFSVLERLGEYLGSAGLPDTSK